MAVVLLAERANALTGPANDAGARATTAPRGIAVTNTSALWITTTVTAAFAGCADPGPLVASDVVQATVCPAGEMIRGIDVSAWEDSVDWTAVRQAGVQFAFIRVGDGAQYQDPTFTGHWASAKAAGVIRGAYQFFRPGQDPAAQADRLLEAIGAPEPGDLPPVIDVEVSDGRTKAQVAAAIEAWVTRVTAAIGRTPIIYTGQYAWAELTGSADSSLLRCGSLSTRPRRARISRNRGHGGSSGRPPTPARSLAFPARWSI